MLLTALFVSPHSYPFALPHAVFGFFLYPVGRPSSFLKEGDLIQQGLLSFSLFLGTALFLNQLDADSGAFEAALLMGGYGLFQGPLGNERSRS